ncbi:MAG TPA: DUF2207 domain-containing protein [Chryseosolibacter sp.]
MLFNTLLLCALCAIGFSASPAFGQETVREEKLLFYGSKIDIDTTGRIHVTETITVRALSQDIRHGIYRSIPTKYKGKLMETVTASLEVTKVLRDGSPEDYFIEEKGNGSNIVIGDKDYELPEGDYTYTIGYTINRQIGFFDDYDEIYWNVTGSGWNFKIDSVYAVVNLPSNSEIIKEKISAYSGASGETGCECRILHVSETSAVFYTTEPLSAYEGLTVAVPFKKGVTMPPSRNEAIDQLIKDNYPGITALAGFFIVLAYYTIAWMLVGIDPRGRTLILRFEPPRNLAPYEIRYIKKMAFDNQTMVVAIVSMAKNGLLTIEEKDNGQYTLTRRANPDHTPTDIEKTMLDTLFSGASSIDLKKNAYNPNFHSALSHLKDHLKKTFSRSTFKLNRPWLGIGVLISIIAVIYSAIQFPFDNSLPGLFLLVWLSGWTFGCYMIIKVSVKLFRERKYTLTTAVFLFMIPFLAGEIFGVVTLAGFFDFYTLSFIVLFVLVNVIFFHLLKAPTLHGRSLLDEIEGFARFLHTSETPRMQSITTGLVMDLRLFEQYFPFALALGLQTDWARRFEEQFSATEQASRFDWYRGISLTHSLRQFSSSLGGSFSSTISSSSTPPGSSSGSSSRGSSGGGGGGGGGGGW